uniref:NUC153 domain-containing protein n=1 Tax=Globodera rostochiensis TaxID=31243 RepID=A0A914HC16_GLORO
MKSKVKGRPTKQRGNAEDDDRFVDLAKNPMFREMRKKEHKIAIDDRFKKMFTDKAFRESAFPLDRRGRATKDARREGYLAHIYDLGDDKEVNPCESGEGTIKSDSECDSSIEEEEDLQQIHLDLARGQGNVSSSSDDESVDEPLVRQEGSDKEEADESPWGELDKAVRRVEWASPRLAICNLDWSNVRAEDLILLLNSLKPTNGQIRSISVYLSDFGAECIERERRDGPMLKFKGSIKKGGEEDLEQRTKQAIREHELDKLRYYYAVCVCDSIDTATAIYESCDGVEYESSGLRFDIRFVPDEMEFEAERIREQILSDQFNADWYQPRRVKTHALTASNPKMSWEMDDPERRRTLKRAFDEEAKLDEFEPFIASGTDEDDDDESQRKAKREVLLAAVREGFEGANAQHAEEVVEDVEQQQKEHEESEDGNISDDKSVDQCDGEDREITDEDSEDEAVEVRRPKSKTKFQMYLERKKQLKQERKQEEAKKRKRRKEEIPSEEAPPAAVDQVERDERFAAFFTDSAFAVDQTAAHYKGGNLAERQAKGRHKRRQPKTFKNSD